MERLIDKPYYEEYKPQLKAIQSAKRLIFVSIFMLVCTLVLVVFGFIGIENLVLLVLYWYTLRRQYIIYNIQKSILELKRYLLEPDFHIDFEENET